MMHTKLGDTDIPLSSLTLGCWAFAGGAFWGDQREADSISVIHCAIDRGVAMLDTAQAYEAGESERVVGLGVKGKRDRVAIATKAPTAINSKEGLIAACEESLKRLKTDYIDLYQVHWPLREMSFGDIAGAMEVLRQSGKIRAAGVCNYGPQDLLDQIAAGDVVVTNQLPYSLLTRAIEFEILPACDQEKVGVLAYSPLMQGLLTGKFKTADDVPEGRARSRHFSGSRPGSRHGSEGCEEATFRAIDRIRGLATSIGKPMEQLALAWALRGQMVNSLIVGARSIEQLENNLSGAELVLEDRVYAQLSEITSEVKGLLGSNPDLWGETSRYR